MTKARLLKELANVPDNAELYILNDEYAEYETVKGCEVQPARADLKGGLRCIYDDSNGDVDIHVILW